VSPTSVNIEVLTECQRSADLGMCAQAMAGYIQWLAPHYGAVKGAMKNRIQLLRQNLTGSTQHRRTPENIANLALGFQTFLEFAAEVGAITEVEADELWKMAWLALNELGSDQNYHQAEEEPARET